MKKSDNTCCSGSPIFVCPITGFKLFWSARFLRAAIVMILWVNIFAALWHGVFMAGDYQATAHLWRGPEAMDPLFLHIGLSLMAFMATLIFYRGYEGGGLQEGVRFGIIIALFQLGLGMITFATQPIPLSIILFWALGDLLTYSLGGVLLVKLR